MNYHRALGNAKNERQLSSREGKRISPRNPLQSEKLDQINQSVQLMNTRHSKEAIIAHGEVLFRSRGYHNTGINEILKTAKISKGSFYNYFASKEDYALEVIQYYGNQVFTLIATHLSDTTVPPLDRLRGFFDMMMAYNEEEKCENGCLVYNFAFEVAGQNPRFSNALEAQITRWLGPIETCIAQGQADGTIRTSHSARELAAVLHTSINGAAGRMKMERSSTPMREVAYTLLTMMAV